MLIPFSLHVKCKICGKAREAEETVVDLNVIGYHKNRGKAGKKKSEMARELLYTYISYLVVVCINYSQTLKNRKAKTIFYQMLPDFRKNMAFMKVPTLFPFVLLVRARCRQRRHEETEVLGQNPVPILLCSPQNSHTLTWNLSSAYAVSGRRPTA
jgi:hypothetical protein